MTYNPRIKNRRNNRLEITGSLLTGSTAIFDIVTGSTISGTTANFGNINVNQINLTNTTTVVNLTASVATTASSVSLTATDSATSTHFVTFVDAATGDKIVRTDTGLTYLPSTNALTASTFVGNLVGNASTVTNGVYTTTIGTVATTAVAAGSGLTGGGTVGSLTLNVGQGDGISVAADTVAVDATVVRTTGVQSIGGVKTFTSDITGTNAFFSGDVKINGTASIGQLNTVNQTSLVVGDKYITILSGAADHASLDASGILWGSGSFADATQNELGSNAHVRYRAASDTIEIFPGLSVSGGTGVQITGNLGVSGSTILNGTLSGTTAQFTSITATTYVGLPSGDVTAAGNNTFTGINTFNTRYITASVGITGSDAKFTSITGAHAGSGAGLTGIPNAALTNSTVTVGTTAISLGGSATTIAGVSVLTASNVTGSDAKFTTLTASHFGSGAGLTGIPNSATTATSANTANTIVARDGSGNFTAGTITAALVGNATTATTATTASNVTLTATSTNASHFVTFVDTSTGDRAVRTDTDLTYNPSTNVLTVVNVSATNVTGSMTGSSALFGTATISSLTAPAFATNVSGVTANFNLGTIGTKHIILADAASAEITGTLPAAATLPFRQFIFKKTDGTANAVALSASAGETIDGDAKVEIVTQYETLTIVSDGVNKWFIV